MPKIVRLWTPQPSGHRVRGRTDLHDVGDAVRRASRARKGCDLSLSSETVVNLGNIEEGAATAWSTTNNASWFPTLAESIAICAP